MQRGQSPRASQNNTADEGFFAWVGHHYHAPTVVVEGKNYEGDATNPELDQVSGRFSARRGEIGLLVGRPFTNRALVIARCRDTALDGRGYIVALDDEDLETQVKARKAGDRPAAIHHLRKSFDVLVYADRKVPPSTAASGYVVCPSPARRHPACRETRKPLN